jgi:DNA-binding transcriptional LysR family regulator
MALDLNDLRYFLEVRAKGSLTKAARSLGVSQPSLTAAMQRLERHFGTTLLLRDHTGVELTVTGKVLARDAEEVFGILRRAEQRVSGLEADEAGRFSVGCHESLAAYFLPEFLRGFFEAHPTIDLSVTNEASASVRDRVIERTVDFGIVVNPRPHADLVLVDMFEDVVDFFVRARGRKSPARTLEEAYERIAVGPVVHAARVAESQALLRRLDQEGCVAERLLACGDFELVKSIVRAGVGVGVLPRRVAAYGHDGEIVRLHPQLPFFADKVFLVFRSDLHRTKAATTLKDALVAHGRRLRAARQ